MTVGMQRSLLHAHIGYLESLPSLPVAIRKALWNFLALLCPFGKDLGVPAAIRKHFLRMGSS